MNNEIARVFSHEEFGQVEVLVKDNVELFKLNDVAFSLGYTKIAKGKKYLRKERIEKIIEQLSITPLNKDNEKVNIDIYLNFEEIFINLKDCITLTKYSHTKNKAKFSKWLEDEFNVVVGSSHIAEDYIPLLCKLFKRYGSVQEYHVDDYRVDLYIKDVGIVVECDEYHHEDKIVSDMERQQYIENKLKCIFIRFNPKNNFDDEIGHIVFQINEQIIRNAVESLLKKK